MKKMTKKMIALFMTLLMVEAMLPITASADSCIQILVELNEPYFGEDLSDLFSEIEFETGYEVLNDGLYFMLYYNTQSNDEIDVAIEKLKTNPIVKDAIYCLPNKNFSETARFLIYMPEDCIKDPDYWEVLELGKYFPEIEFSKANTYGTIMYEVYCDVSTMEETFLIYDKFRESPFVTEFYYYINSNFATPGRIQVTLKKNYTAEEIEDLFPELEITRVTNIYATEYYLYLKDKDLRSTLEAAKVLEENPNVVFVKYTQGTGLPCVAPEEIDESYYKPVERPEVTVETALAALRITAGLSEAKNGVYDYRLADALWQFDVDGDKVITVSDALSLLRIAAGIKA